MRSNLEWKWWGEHDPLFAVASWPGKQSDGPGAWTATEFLALGASDFADICRHWDHYGRVPHRCIEIGCGAGRITGELAAVFQTVFALDVSVHQMEKAKEMLGGRASNVEFQLVEEPRIRVADASCSAMFSCHVFQHFVAFDDVVTYLKETYRALAPGGTCCFHIPVPGAHLTSQHSLLYLWLRNNYRRIKRLLGGRRFTEYHRYDTRTVFDVLTRLGFADLEMRIFAMHSNGDFHSFFFATKRER